MKLDEQAQQAIDSTMDDMLEDLRVQVKAKAEQLMSAIPPEYCLDPQSGIIQTQYSTKAECESNTFEWIVNLEKKQKIVRNNEKLKQVCSNPNYTTELACTQAGESWTTDFSYQFANKYLDQVQSWISGHARNIESSPTLYLAPRTTLIKVPYGTIRQAAAAHESIIAVPYSTSNPLRLDKRIFKKNNSKVTFSKDDGMYLGFTKASLAAIAAGTSLPKGNIKTAPFTTPIKGITYDDSIGELTILLYNRPGSGSAFGPEKWSNYVNIPLEDDSKDSLDIELGRYSDPTNPSAAGVVENFMNGWKYEVSHALSGQMRDTSQAFLTALDEEVFDRQFICCIFFEILNNSTDDISFTWVKGQKTCSDPQYTTEGACKGAGETWTLSGVEGDEVKGTPKEMYQKLLENKAEVEDFLEKNKEFLRDAKSVIEILLGYFSANQVGITIPGMGINVTRILLNAVYMVAIITAEEIQSKALQRQMKWLEKQKKKTLEAAKGDVAAAVMKCLPLERLIIVIINALFGKEGMLKWVTGLVTRMKRALLLKGEAFQKDKNLSASNKSSAKFIPLLKGTLDIINMLLQLNVGAWDLCQSYGDKYLEDDEQAAGDGSAEGAGIGGDSSIGDYTIDGSEDGTDASIPIQAGLASGSQNLGINDGSDGSMDANSMTVRSTIDITNSTIDPLKLLIMKDDNEITKFFSQYLEFSPEEAAGLVQQAKTGECLKNIGPEDAEALKALFNQAGVNL